MPSCQSDPAWMVGWRNINVLDISHIWWALFTPFIKAVLYHTHSKWRDIHANFYFLSTLSFCHSFYIWLRNKSRHGRNYKAEWYPRWGLILNINFFQAKKRISIKVRNHCILGSWNSNDAACITFYSFSSGIYCINILLDMSRVVY